MWSSKGINVNPDNYIAKTDAFSGDVEGYYNKPGGFNVKNAETADNAVNAANASFATSAGSLLCNHRRISYNSR